MVGVLPSPSPSLAHVDMMYHLLSYFSTYDHRTMRIRLPVRSAIYKHCTGGLVVRWVTTSESPLLYVFAFFLLFFFWWWRRVGGVGRFFGSTYASKGKQQYSP